MEDRDMAEFGSSEAGKRGGNARAKALTPEERSEIARKAAAGRWNKEPGEKAGHPRATHAGVLHIGDIELPCAVLEDGTRVFTQEGFLQAIGRSRKAPGIAPKAGQGENEQVEQLPAFLNAANLKPFVTEELEKSSRPILFRPLVQSPNSETLVMGNKGLAKGYRVELLPLVCGVYLSARSAGVLTKSKQFGQMRIAAQCEILVRGLSTVGIIALVDEATGYQDTRAKDALAKILEKFVAKEIQHVVRLFPLEYFKGLCRLWNVPFSPDMKLPRYFGTLTNNIIYARLAPAVLEEIQRKNPVVNGRRKVKNYNWLTRDVGHPKVLQLLGSVCTIMDFADGDKDRFWELLNRRHPKYKDLPLFRGIELE